MKSDIVEKMLKGANDRRLTRLVSLYQVTKAYVFLENNMAEYVSLTGGGVPNSYKYPASSTVALLYKDINRNIYFNCGVSSAHSTPSPGRIWKTLSPWRDGMDLSIVIPKLDYWSKNYGTVDIT
jgi:hypothetical protein